MASKALRFSGGPPVPNIRGQTPSPGEPIVAHLQRLLPTLGVQVLKHEDIEYAHELQCQVGGFVYGVYVSYDWLQEGWWEVFWKPALGFFQRLLGQSEERELGQLALAVSQALASLPGIREKRWYANYIASTKSRSQFTTMPVV